MKYLFYSPDNDVIILCLLLTVKMSEENSQKISKLKMLRHNQQTGGYEIIDIDEYRDILYQEIQKYLDDKGKLDQDCIIDDIVFIYTLWGNDFVIMKNEIYR